MYKTLDEALAVAEEGTIIKLTEGVYTCNVVIDKPGIKIEPRDKDKPVYLLGNEGPVVKIDMKERNHYVVMKRLLLAHSGLNLVKKFKAVQEQFVFAHAKKANPKTIKNFDINKNMDTVVLVKKGGLVMRNCLVSLRSLPKNLI
jgi:F-box protein 11